MDVLLALDLTNWFRDQKGVVQAAVIGGTVAAGSALITGSVSITNIVLKDRLDRAVARSRGKDLQRDLYRRYADPLTTAAESLYWRLNEIFDSGGGYYLLAGGGDTQFERYKVDTTQYRLAALLGWIAALRKELVLSAAQPDPSLGPMRAALQSVTKALAEGAHIEQAMLNSLAKLWNVSGIESASSAGRLLHATQKRFLHASSVEDVEALDGLSQLKLVRELADVLGSTYNVKINDETLASTLAGAISSLAVREAWIFRDWQDAIGEWMLVETKSGPRRFDVAGFRTFIRVPIRRDDHQWRQHLSALIVGLDVDGDQLRDARIAQLGEVYLSVASLLVEFHESEPRRSAVAESTLKAAKRTIRTRGPAAPPKRYLPRRLNRRSRA